jgi:chromosome partitioning protein
MMAAKIISITNQKGGVGKSTTTMLIAGGFAKKHLRVFVADADKQRTATRWAKEAPEHSPFPAHIYPMGDYEDTIHREIRKVVENYDVILIDCPPAVESPIPQSALQVADLALIPMIPSPPDIWAAAGIDNLVKRVIITNPTLQARILVNMAQERTMLSRKVEELLEAFGIPILRQRFVQREIYRHTAGFGLTIYGMTGETAHVAQREVTGVTEEVLTVFA